MKSVVIGLIAMNIALIALALYLFFGVESPSEFVKGGRVFILGTSLVFLVLNMKMYKLV